jgi:DNA-binding response OmpR family regulator
MGAAAFVAKPFEMDELLDALRSVLVTRTDEGWDPSLDALFGRHAPGTAPA